MRRKRNRDELELSRVVEGDDSLDVLVHARINCECWRSVKTPLGQIFEHVWINGVLIKALHQ